MERHKCLALLGRKLKRTAITLIITTRGRRPRPSAEIAYREGQIL